MGHGTFRSSDWDDFSQTYNTKTKPFTETFSKVADSKFLPINIETRESCVSQDKPVVTPIIIALDVTGSMHQIPGHLIQGGLGTLMEKILAQASIPNPHIMFMAVGDVECDRYPLQVTQFEADIRIAEQLKSLYLEGGGGSNLWESYTLPWYFAATRTKLDSLKSGQKGIIFTLGDEHAPPEISAENMRKFMGDQDARTWTTDEILQKTRESYDVFHLGITQGRSYTPAVTAQWQNLLGQNFIPVKDYTKVDEVIVNTIVRLVAERKVIRDSMASRASTLLNMSGIGSIRALREESQPMSPPPDYFDVVPNAHRP